MRRAYTFLASFGDKDLEVRISLMVYGSIAINVGGYSFASVVNNHRIGWTVYREGQDPGTFREYTITIDDLDALLDRCVEARLIQTGDTINYGSGWKIYYIGKNR